MNRPWPHSTGPRTESGKSRSSRNNFRHGFRSQSVLLPGDDPAEYESLLNELSGHFGPRDLTEDRLVREMADAEWRVRRVRQYIESALTRRICELSTEHPDFDPITLQTLAIESLQTSFSTWLSYESKFERQYERAYNAWYRYQNMRRSAAARDADTLYKQAIAAPVTTAPATLSDNRSGLIPEMPDRSEAPVVGELAPNVQKSPDTRISAASVPPTPRSAPCPCGSGQKYKRCCGHNAAPVILMPRNNPDYPSTV